jgi:hypothetical protein
MRHSICVFGLEDLALHLLQWPHLFANKFQPDFDFGAILCWYEAMHSRSHDPPESEQAMALLDKKFYEDLAHVHFSMICLFSRNFLRSVSRNSKEPWPR